MFAHMRRRSAAVLAFTLLCSGTLHAQDSPARPGREAMQTGVVVPRARAATRVDFAARVAGGVGIGRPGLGYRLGIAGEYWLTDLVGVGLYAGLARQSGILGPESASEVVGFAATLRSVPGPSFVMLSIGAGYAHVAHVYGSGLCIDWNGGGCAERPVARYHGYSLGLALAWLTHPGTSALELGPSLRFDVFADPRGRAPLDFLAIIGIELGIGELR